MSEMEKPTELQIRRALRCQTCNGPHRETKGLVCQVCGWDYGTSGEPRRANTVA